MNFRNIPIIDTYHHLWNIQQNYIPWLCDTRPIQFRYSDYRVIRHNYLLKDFRQDHAEFNLIGSVYVESEWDPTDPIGETCCWLHDLAENEDIPNAYGGPGTFKS